MFITIVPFYKFFYNNSRNFHNFQTFQAPNFKIPKLAQFYFPSLTVDMLKRGVNPFVVDYDGDTQFNYFNKNFKSVPKNILEKYSPSLNSTEVYYATHEIKCGSNCSSKCSDKMKGAVFYEGGELLSRRYLSLLKRGSGFL